jgi:hypothetical protein
VADGVGEVVAELWTGGLVSTVAAHAHEVGGAMVTVSSSLGFSVRVGGGMRPRRSVWSGAALLVKRS